MGCLPTKTVMATDRETAMGFSAAQNYNVSSDADVHSALPQRVAMLMSMQNGEEGSELLSSLPKRIQEMHEDPKVKELLSKLHDPANVKMFSVSPEGQQAMLESMETTLREVAVGQPELKESMEALLKQFQGQLRHTN
mmetsp:Transcript_22513/g.42159  ORF Transcript_22513/g.42159 Transcript_22513/m.42159 type:complete len:138 (-) Transcript_22513:121-534(-)